MGLAQEQVAAGDHEAKIALGIDSHLACPQTVEGDDLWVDTTGNDEVIFQTSWYSVVDRADARVHVFVAHAGEGGDPGTPLFGIVADKIVHFAWKLVRAGDARRAVTTYETHPHRSKGLWFRNRASG